MKKVEPGERCSYWWRRHTVRKQPLEETRDGVLLSVGSRLEEFSRSYLGGQSIFAIYLGVLRFCSSIRRRQSRAVYMYSLCRHTTLRRCRRYRRCHPTLCPLLGCASSCSVSDSVVALLWLPESEFLTGVFVSLHHHGSAPLICVCTGPPSYLFLTSLRPKWISALIAKIQCCIYFLVRRIQDNATRKKQKYQKASVFTSK